MRLKLFLMLCLVGSVFTGYLAWRSSQTSCTGDAIVSATFAPDGNTLLLIQKSGQGAIWSTSPLRSKDSYRFALDWGFGGVSVAFSPDGTTILTGGIDHMARLWDVQTGRQLHLLTGHTNTIQGVAFSPDGKQAITGSADYSARIWDTQTGALLRVLVLSAPPTDTRYGYEGIVSVAFSPDSRTALTGDVAGDTELWDIETGRVLRVFAHRTAEAEDAKVPAEIKGPWVYGSWEIQSVAFSPDGKTILTGSGDYTGRLWDVQSGRLLHTLYGAQDGVAAAVFSPDGKLVATGHWASELILWDANTGNRIREMGPWPGFDSLFSVAFSPDGQTIAAVGARGMVYLWNVQTGTLRQAFEGYRDYYGYGWNYLWSVVFSPDDQTLLTGGANNTANLWDLRTGTHLRAFNPTEHYHLGNVECAVFSPDGQRILTGSADWTARLWDVQTGHLLNILIGHQFTVSSVVFSSDGRQILTGSFDGTARLWDAQTGVPVRTFSGEIGALHDAAFSHDGTRILTAGHSGTAQLWNSQTGQLIASFRPNIPDDVDPSIHALSGLALSPDDQLLATGSADWIVRVWDVHTGLEAIPPVSLGGRVYSLKFSPDGNRLAVSGESGVVRLWDRQQNFWYSLLGYNSPVLSFDFSADSHLLLTGDAEGYAEIWDMETNTRLARFCASVSPDLAESLVFPALVTMLSMWFVLLIALKLK